MGHGGRRPGAGRKPGRATRKTREIADQAAATGLTPLEVMLEAMRRHMANNDWDRAASIAKDAAPYMHPRFSAVEVSRKTTDEIDELRKLAEMAKRYYRESRGNGSDSSTESSQN
jgi:hypothetical protein